MASRLFGLRRGAWAMAFLASLLAGSLAGCQFTPKDDPLVIRDDDPLKAFMFPASRHMAWTYRRESVGLVPHEATVSIAVATRKKDSAQLSYAIEGGEAPEVARGIGLRGEAAITLLADGAVRWKDLAGDWVYHPDGTVKPGADAKGAKGKGAASADAGVTFELVGTETITTPAGKFACVKYRLRRSPSADYPMRLEGTQWWGKGAGLVRAVSNVEGFSAGTRTTIELISLER